MRVSIKQPSVVVQQLTLDIEQYLGDAVRTTADWGHRYLAFIDYDLQIIEVHIIVIIDNFFCFAPVLSNTEPLGLPRKEIYKLISHSDSQ